LLMDFCVKAVPIHVMAPYDSILSSQPMETCLNLGSIDISFWPCK
jgi:hypothetical protein